MPPINCFAFFLTEPAVVPQSKVELEPPMVNGVGRHQSNSGSDVAGTGSDKNNNVRRSYANLNTIPEAVSALSKEVDAINTIKRLTLQLELKDQAVNDLREKVRNFVFLFLTKCGTS